MSLLQPSEKSREENSFYLKTYVSSHFRKCLGLGANPKYFDYNQIQDSTKMLQTYSFYKAIIYLPSLQNHAIDCLQSAISTSRTPPISVLKTLVLSRNVCLELFANALDWVTGQYTPAPIRPNHVVDVLSRPRDCFSVQLRFVGTQLIQDWIIVLSA